MARHKPARNIFDDIESGESTLGSTPFRANDGTPESGVNDGGGEEGRSRSDFNGGFYVPNNLLKGDDPGLNLPKPEAITEGEKGGGLLSSLSEAVTGAKRTTKELDALPTIASAPELRELSFSNLKIAAGFLTTGDTKRLEGILKKNLLDAKFRSDKKGNRILSLPSGDYPINPPGVDGLDIARGVIDIAAFTPVGRVASLTANVAGRIAIGAAGSAGVEAGKEAIISGVGGGPINTENIILGGALGGVGQGVGDLIGAGAKAIKVKVSEADQAIIDTGQRTGVDVKTTDIIDSGISRLVDKVGSEIPIVGTGGSRITQETARIKAVDDLLEGSPDVSSEVIFANLKNNVNKVKVAAGNSLGATGQRMDEVGDVDVRNLVTSVNRALSNLRSVRGQVDETAIQKLAELQAVLRPIDGVGFKFSQLKNQRTTSRGEFDNIDPISRSQLSSFGKAQTNAVMKEFTKTLDGFVRVNSNARQFGQYKRANTIYGEEARKLSKGRLKSVLDNGEVTPEKVNALITSRNRSEIENLYKGLDFQGKENVRSAILHDVARKSIKNEQLDVNAFIKNLDKMDKSTGIFFKGTNGAQLNGLKKLLRTTDKAQTSKPGLAGAARVAGSIGGASLLTGLIPALVGATTIGAAARIYESRPVRTMLLRIANETVGSRRIDDIVDKFTPSITAALQNVRRETDLLNK